jgi:hypothetical protein
MSVIYSDPAPYEKITRDEGIREKKNKYALKGEIKDGDSLQADVNFKAQVSCQTFYCPTPTPN